MAINKLIMASLLAFISPSTGTLPNLCDDVYLDEDGVPLHDSTGLALARYCEQTGPRAPRWDGAVCCSFDAAGSHCTPPSSTGGCADKATMWCDYGARAADGSVTCYQPLPSACDIVPCVDAPPGASSLADVVPLCCFPWGGCIEPAVVGSCEGGLLSYCMSPFTGEDGWVGCADDD